MLKEIEHRGYVIGWQEPPATSGGWELHIASNDPGLQAILLQFTNSHGSYPLRFNGQLEAALAEACQTIDQWLDTGR